MSLEKKEKNPIDNSYETYFSHFSHQLYDNPIDPQEDYNINFLKDQGTNDSSSTNYSNNSIKEISDDDEEKFIPLDLFNTTSSEPISAPIEDVDNPDYPNSKEIKPELQKFQLPKSLFNSSVKKSNNNCFNESLTKQLNLKCKPFIPKNKKFTDVTKNEYNILFPQKTQDFTNEFKNDLNYNKKKKKRNREFKEREGDWPCYKCKNLNFKFRNKCNKCGLSKEESEQKFCEVEEQLLKLADLSIYDKK